MSAEARKRRLLARAALPFAILLAAGAAAAYLRATRPTVEPKPPQERVWTVATVPVRHTDERPTLSAFGEIVAGREASLRPLVAGRIVEVGKRFIDGGALRKGDLVVAIDPFDYRSAIAEIEAQQAAARGRLDQIEAELAAAHEQIEQDRRLVAISQRDVDRRETLRRSSAGSEKALDEARRALIQARQQLIARKEAINRLTAQAAEAKAALDRWAVLLRRARQDLERTRLLAPFDGYLADIDAAVGKQVGPGDQLARLIDAARLEVRFHLGDAAFARLLAAGPIQGRPVRVFWTLGDKTFTYAGALDRLGSRVESESGGMNLYARIRTNGLESPLRPGAFVRVEIPDRLYRGVVRLPADALFGEDTVYVAVDDRLEARKVALRARAGADILVSGDLADGEAVVVTRFPEIGPGLKVALR